MADLRAQLQKQSGQLDSTAGLEGALTEQHGEIEQLHSQLLEQQQANDGLQREATLAHIQLEESREAFRVRIQHCMLEVCSPMADEVKLVPSNCIHDILTDTKCTCCMRWIAAIWHVWYGAGVLCF